MRPYWSILGSVDAEIALPLRIGEHEGIALTERPRRVDDLQRPAAQRKTVLALRLHPQGRNGQMRPACVCLSSPAGIRREMYSMQRVALRSTCARTGGFRFSSSCAS